MLVQLWCRPTAAAPIRPLAQELLYATGAAVKRKKEKKKKKSKYYLELNLWLSMNLL